MWLTGGAKLTAKNSLGILGNSINSLGFFWNSEKFLAINDGGAKLIAKNILGIVRNSINSLGILGNSINSWQSTMGVQN